ncbi:MAG: hypothetical protein J0M18_06555 [Ignavibacteria bacterium]|nr:hypothetical protein [Ignavibacteria bacterium]
MNKYLVTIPYNYVQFGKLTCFIYADNSDEALELAMDSSNRTDKDYDDDGSDGTNFSYDEMTIETEEEDVTIPNPSPINSEINTSTATQTSTYSLIPDYFLADIQLL